MRALFGLAFLAAVNGQFCSNPASLPCVTLGGANTGSTAASPIPGSAGLPIINVYLGAGTTGGYANVQISNGNGLVSAPQVNAGGSTYVTTNNFFVSVWWNVPTITFQFTFNQYTGQVQHRWGPVGYNPGSGVSTLTYVCDTCSGGTLTSCNTPTGPGTISNGAGVGTSPASGYQCSSFTRTYTFSNLQQSTAATTVTNIFAVGVFDLTPLFSSYSFQIYRLAPPVTGDPQIIGLQGQDFQVHGMPDEVFNMITYPNLQVNARFVYLSNGECHDNFTACFAHPGTYISDEGIRLGSDKIHVRSGSFKKGLTVSVNGQKVSSKTTSVKLGKIELVNHRRVVISTPIMNIQISNSDNFLNQELTLEDKKLLSIGSERRALHDGESFHSEIPLHGLQGQTWRNVEYPSGLDYEGSILDYHITSGDLFGTDFVFNKFGKH